MRNYFTVLDDILYKGKRPWLEANNPDERFASMISGVKPVEPAFQPKYRIQFERPFNNKTKYYSKLILNEKIKTTNLLLEALQEDNNPQLIKYRLNVTLNKKLKTKIKDIGSIIKEQQFDLSFINPRKTTFDLDQEHKTNTYIFQLLKISLIHIYLEIQAVFKDQIQDIFVIEDFYSQLLFEQIPERTYLEQIQNVELSQTPETGKESEEDAKVSLQSFTYIDYYKNSDKLTNLCDSLKKSGFIHASTKTVNFKKVFSGKEITTPVIWTGNPSEFSYFIKLIYNKHKLVGDLKQKQWKVAVQCFIREDGTQFQTSIRKLHRPSLTDKKLDRAVSLLL